MNKTIYLKSVLLLCLLLAGVVNAHAVNYEWVKTSLSDLQTNDVVVIADDSYGIALPNNDVNFKGVSVEFGSNDNKITGTVSEGIQWKLRKNDNIITLLQSNSPLVASTGGELKVGGSGTHEFTYNSGQLSCSTGSTTYYIYWWEDNSGYYAKLSTDANQTSRTDFAFYKRVEVQTPKYVKWKLVDGDKVTLTNGDVVVIADATTGLAMSNDKADKDPDAVAVTLNYDKDRILGEVPENVLWTYTATNDGFQFAADGYLYADSKGLKVGSETPNVFDIFSYTDTEAQTTTDYLHIKVSDKDYLAGVEESMFSNTWKLKELKEGKPDDKVKNTRFAIFKKVEDEQTIPTVSFPCNDYEINSSNTLSNNLGTHIYTQYVKATCQEGYTVGHYSSNEDVAYPVSGDNWQVADPNSNSLVLLDRGTIKLIARVEEEPGVHDKAVVTCTIRINDNRTDLGTKTNPLTPSQAIQLANGELQGYTLQPDRCYFIKGKVNKVNSGLLGMFGDMGLGDMFEGMEGMDDMDDFDMSEMGSMMGGMDFMSMIPGFAHSDGLTYYISDDGTKENRLKISNGRGLVSLTATGINNYEKAEFDKLEDLSPGDDVLVYGPIEISEDKNLFSSLGSFGEGIGTGQGTGEGTGQGTGQGTGSIPGMGNSGPTIKVGELNYLHDIRRVLQVPGTSAGENPHMYKNTEKSMTNTAHDYFYNIYTGESEKGLIKNPVNHSEEIMQPSLKSADEEIAKWEDAEGENANGGTLTAVEEGKTKITVKVKVVLQDKTDDQDELSYTMKRKFQLEVLPRDKEPEGKNVGEYVLMKEGDEIVDGTRLLIIGTRTKTDKENNKQTKTKYALGANNTMMGGGKEGKTVEDDKFSTKDGRERIKYVDVPEGVQEIILEQDGDGWRLNVGEDENGTKLYLYATEKKEEQTSDEEEGFNFDEMMEMFMPSTGLKVGTEADALAEAEGEDGKESDIVVSLKANISISNDIATISFVGDGFGEGKKNTIMLASSFDMDSMMEMFGGMGQKENTEGETTSDETQTTEENSSSFNMGDFDMFMASFNTKKIGDETAEEGKDPKCFLPRIFGFVQYDEYPITVTSAEWKTIVSDYDVELADGIEAYVVIGVTYDNTRNQCVAKLKQVKEKLRGGVPYLLHSPSAEYKMTKIKWETEDQRAPEPKPNLLKVSDKTINGSAGLSSPYFLLANKTPKGVGFYRWTGGVLGKGRVYLEVTDDTVAETGGLAKAVEFCAFEIDNTTAISEIEQSESETKRYYNLSGQRVTKPIQKGVYVVNGKTVVVK